jgi:hypothetical protein
MKYEKMAMEIIEFLQKWGLWEGTLIFSDGNMYAYSLEKTDVYNKIPFVIFKENVDSTKYTTENECDYSNPKHLFDMVYDGALYTLLNDRVYEVNGCDLSYDAWEEIFQHTDLLNNYTADNYDVYDAEDVLEKIVFNNSDESDSAFWNLLEFDTWDDYLKFCGVENFYESYDNKNLPNGYEVLGVDDIMPIWDKIADKAKAEIKKEYNSESLYLPEIVDYVIEKFKATPHNPPKKSKSDPTPLIKA